MKFCLPMCLFFSCAVLMCNAQDAPRIKISNPNDSNAATIELKNPTPLTKFKPIPNLNRFIEHAATIQTTVWDLVYHYNEPKEKPVSNTQKATLVTSDLVSGRLPENYKKYVPTMVNIYNRLTIFGADALGNFFAATDEPQFGLVKYEADQQNILIIDGATSDDVFNTNRLTSKQRASIVLKNHILPSLKLINEVLPTVGIKYIGMSFTYGSKNFIDGDKALNLEAEYLCAVFPLTAVKMYNNNAISEDELLLKSSFYLKDRDALNVSKVLLTIE